MITGYWCDVHRGTGTDVQTHENFKGIVVGICSDCWDDMADETRDTYGLPVGRRLRVDLHALSHALGGRQ